MRKTELERTRQQDDEEFEESLKQGFLWFRTLSERLLEQEQIENECFQYRMDSDSEGGKRLLLRFYPLEYAITACNWKLAYALYQKGYGYLEGTENNIDWNTIRSTSKYTFFGVSEFTIGHAMKEMVNYFFLCGRKQERDHILELMTHITKADSAKENIMLHYMRGVICELQSGADVTRMEKMLCAVQRDYPALYEKLTCFDGVLLSLGCFADHNNGMLPGFLLVQKWLEEQVEERESQGSKEVLWERCFRDLFDVWEKSQGQYEGTEDQMKAMLQRVRAFLEKHIDKEYAKKALEHVREVTGRTSYGEVFT